LLLFVFDKSRDFKILNLFKFFFREGKLVRLTTKRARDSKIEKHARTQKRERVVLVFSLHTRAYTRTHTHTHTRSLSQRVLRRWRESSPKKKDLSVFVFKNSLSATPGRKSLKKDVLASVQTKRVQDRSGETKVGATETTERNREEEIG
jgi:hypothetical protein